MSGQACRCVYEHHLPQFRVTCCPLKMGFPILLPATSLLKEHLKGLGNSLCFHQFLSICLFNNNHSTWGMILSISSYTHWPFFCLLCKKKNEYSIVCMFYVLVSMNLCPCAHVHVPMKAKEGYQVPLSITLYLYFMR